MQFKNFKLVGYVIYGKGCVQDLQEILSHQRKNNQPMVYFIDHFFKNKEAYTKQFNIPSTDHIIFVDVTHEPKTKYVDELVMHIKQQFSQGISGIVGIGGGSTLDLTKAVAIMYNNEGKAQDYQGWDLVKNKALYKVGIPTLSGTGAEVSRTCVLTGPTKKLGINSDFTPFDQIVLDPNLILNAPADQRFYTGMDCYIHCIESLEGTYLNQFSQSYGEKALALCQDIFLDNAEWTPLKDEKLMMASYAGGMSIAYSQVGVAHALSYGLSFVMGTKHGIGNCLVFNHLEKYYPQGVAEFKKMLQINNISLPTNYTKHLSQTEMDTMVSVSLGLAPLWENALGKDWKNKIDASTIEAIYRKI